MIARQYCIITAILMCMTFIQSVSASCLTQEEMSAVNNVTSALNISNTSITRVFERLCMDINTTNETTRSNTGSIISINTSLKNYSTESSLLSNVSALNTTAHNIESMLVSNVLALNSSIRDTSVILVENISSKSATLENIFDEKVKGLKRDFATRDELNQTKFWVESYIRTNIPWWVYWTPAILGSFILGGFGYFYLQRRKDMKMSPLMPSVNPETHMIEELATDSDLKKSRIDVKKAKEMILSSAKDSDWKLRALEQLFRGIVTRKELELLLEEGGHEKKQKHKH